MPGRPVVVPLSVVLEASVVAARSESLVDASRLAAKMKLKWNGLVAPGSQGREHDTA